MLLLSLCWSTLSELHSPCWDLAWMNCNCSMSNCFLNNSHFFSAPGFLHSHEIWHHFHQDHSVVYVTTSYSFYLNGKYKQFILRHIMKTCLSSRKTSLIYIVGSINYINALQYYKFCKTSTEPKPILLLHLLFFSLREFGIPKSTLLYFSIWADFLALGAKNLWSWSSINKLTSVSKQLCIASGNMLPTLQILHTCYPSKYLWN